MNVARLAYTEASKHMPNAWKPYFRIGQTWQGQGNFKEANNQIGFQHPTISNLNYISFCQFMEPIQFNSNGQKIAKNTVKKVYIR